MTLSREVPLDYRRWKSWKPEDFGEYSDIDSITFRRELELAGVSLSQPRAIFEIGFGNGQFSKWAKDQGHSVTGTELDGQLVELANASGIEAYPSNQTLLSIANGRLFDLVVAFDVFEHIDLGDLLQLVSQVRRILKPSGFLIARFPSGDSSFSGSVQHSDMTHKTVLGSGMVEQIALATLFRVVQIREPAFPLSHLGLRRGIRRLAVKVMRQAVTPIIRFGYHDGQRLVLTRNMIAVLQPC